MPESRVATRDDVDLVARICAEGFFDDPVLGWCIRDTSTRMARLEYLFRGLATDMLGPGRGVVHVVEDVCVSLWRTPDFDHHAEADGPEDGARADRVDLPLDEVDLTRLAVLDEVMHDNHPHEAHWYLNVVSTMPRWQGKGLGGRALTSVLEQCDTDSARAYLESTNPRNRTLYRRNGFVDADELEIPDGPSMLAMWRDPMR